VLALGFTGINAFNILTYDMFYAVAANAGYLRNVEPGGLLQKIILLNRFLEQTRVTILPA
jgi:hypothetical protein